MAKKNSGYQAIRVYGPTVGGPFKVDMGVAGRRPVRFAGLTAAREFVEGFAFDKLTVQIGPPIPTDFMR